MAAAPETDVNEIAEGLSLGDVLRRRRREYGLAIDDVEAELCIRRGYLEAIEAGDYEVLPGTTYALGFVRAYADFIGLDPDQMVRRFKVEALGAPAPSPNSAATANAPARKRKFPIGLAAAGAAIAVVAGLGAWTLSTLENGGGVAAFVASLTAPSPDAEVATSAAGAPTAAVTPTPTAAPEAASIAAVPASFAAAAAAVPDQQTRPTAADTTNGIKAAVVVPVVKSDIDDLAAAAEPPVEDVVDADFGAAVRLTPRPKGRPIPGLGPVAPSTTPPTPTVVTVPATPAAEAPAQVAAIPPATSETTVKVEKDPETTPPAAAPIPARQSVTYGTPGHSRVKFTAVSTTRIRVHSTGGEVLFDGVMLPGDVYRVPNRPGLMLMTESAGDLKFSVDGAGVPSIGPKGALRHNVFLNPMLLRNGRAAPH